MSAGRHPDFATWPSSHHVWIDGGDTGVTDELPSGGLAAHLAVVLVAGHGK
jgi:hypothetical protein